MTTRQRDPAEIALEDVPEDTTDNEQIINDLEKEIHLLQQRLNQYRHDGKHKQDPSSPLPSLESVTEQIHELEQLLKENEILSGLTISETSCTVLEQNAMSSITRHNVSGEAGGMPFKLWYDVREYFEKTEAGQPQAQVMTLEMDVRADMDALLHSHLCSVASEKNIKDLFQLLSSYGRWMEDRERTINHFSSTYSDLVRRIDADDQAQNISMVISDPKLHVKFTIEWGLRVLPMRSVVPDLSLMVQVPPEVEAKDKKGVYRSAPEVFQLMLKKFGIESALHLLVKLMDED